VEAPEWAGLLGRDGHLDALPTERGAYPEFYRLLAGKIHDGGAASGAPLPVDPADAVETLKIIEAARGLAR
jgi:predicted dehydrogenase